VIEVDVRHVDMSNVFERIPSGFHSSPEIGVERFRASFNENRPLRCFNQEGTDGALGLKM